MHCPLLLIWPQGLGWRINYLNVSSGLRGSGQESWFLTDWLHYMLGRPISISHFQISGELTCRWTLTFPKFPLYHPIKQEPPQHMHTISFQLFWLKDNYASWKRKSNQGGWAFLFHKHPHTTHSLLLASINTSPWQLSLLFELQHLPWSDPSSFLCHFSLTTPHSHWLTFLFLEMPSLSPALDI